MAQPRNSNWDASKDASYKVLNGLPWPAPPTSPMVFKNSRSGHGDSVQNFTFDTTPGKDAKTQERRS